MGGGQGSNIVLEALVDSIALKTPTLSWKTTSPTPDDLAFLQREALSHSRFDPLFLRLTMFDAYKEGKASLVSKTLGNLAKVVVLAFPEQVAKIPWTLFAQIFQAFGPHPKGPWRATLFASPQPRLLPPPGSSTGPGPGHCNGGYAIPGRQDSIVIYRFEEAARVLVHELLHAAGTDSFAHSEQERETRTESFAELFLIAICSGGNLKKARQLWARQAEWIVKQEAVLKGVYGVLSPASYVYRYTVGRRPYMEVHLGLQFPSVANAASPESIGNSLRFTAPELCP